MDDDEVWREIIRSRLGDHHIDSAGSLQQAIDLLRSEPSYDVALVDLNLAGDSDLEGGDLLDLMKIRYPSVRRVLITGSPPGGSVRKNIFERYEVDEIIIKRDMSVPDLRRVVEEAVTQAPDAEGYSEPGLEAPRKGRTLRERSVVSRPHGESLPEPDPAEVRSPAGQRSQNYAVGGIIDSRFEVLAVLGRGGFSTVYRVQDHVEGEERALKLFDSPAGYEAVRREISALRKIHHPNVVEVFWSGKTSAGDWYLISEFIDGESLDEFVTGKRRLRDREAVDVALDLLNALISFHPDARRLGELDARIHGVDLSEGERREQLELRDKGLVHRDIKPLNVMLTRSGAKLLDFNIASRVGDPVQTKSGTLPYQPPDASLTRWDVSPDLFAVGVLLYQLLCDGKHPFPNAMPAVGQAVTDPRTFRPGLSSDLAEFLIKACAPANADRYSTAAEMELDLRHIRAQL